MFTIPRLRRHTRDAASAPLVGALQDLDHVDVDQLYDFEQGHTINNFGGSAYTRLKADIPPPIDYDEAEDVPRGVVDYTIEAYYPATRLGVGPEDAEPMIPEGLS